MTYVANSDSDTVSVIDAATDTVAATIPVGDGPAGLALTPGGTRVYVANADSNDVSVIDTSSNAVIATIPVGGTPLDVAVSPGGGACAPIAEPAGVVTSRGYGRWAAIPVIRHAVVASG